MQIESELVDRARKRLRIAASSLNGSRSWSRPAASRPRSSARRKARRDLIVLGSRERRSDLSSAGHDPAAPPATCSQCVQFHRGQCPARGALHVLRRGAARSRPAPAATAPTSMTKNTETKRRHERRAAAQRGRGRASTSARTTSTSNRSPTKGHYAFSYTITIRNEGQVPARLLTRHWVITDANGKVKEVHGEGVVGEQPYLKPGQGFRYSSGAMLETPVGAMQGSYPDGRRRRRAVRRADRARSRSPCRGCCTDDAAFVAVYAIGDVQGCCDEFEALLAAARLRPAARSAVVRRRSRQPRTALARRAAPGRGDGRRAIVVLGNHDLHLLAAALHASPAQGRDTARARSSSPGSRRAARLAALAAHAASRPPRSAHDGPRRAAAAVGSADRASCARELEEALRDERKLPGALHAHVRR